MNIDLARLIEALRRALNDSIEPELNSDYARGQLAAVHDILGKLVGMTVWDPQALRAQAEALNAGIQRFTECAACAGVTLPRHEASSDLSTVQRRTRELTDWLDEQGTLLPPDLQAQLDAILRQMLREQLRVERQRTPLTDFSAMTAAATKD